MPARGGRHGDLIQDMRGHVPPRTRWFSLFSVTKRVGLTAVAASAALVVAACGSSGGSSSSTSSPGSSGGSVPQLSVNQINNSFSAMATLKPLAAKGKGNVAVILPDTVSSTRYVEFDAPYLKESFAKAGLKPSQYTVQRSEERRVGRECALGRQRDG